VQDESTVRPGLQGHSSHWLSLFTQGVVAVSSRPIARITRAAGLPTPPTHKYAYRLLYTSKAVCVPSHNRQWERAYRPPDPLTKGSAPGPRWGHSPQTPIIGSRYRARHSPPPNAQTKLRLWTLHCFVWSGHVGRSCRPCVAGLRYAFYIQERNSVVHVSASAKHAANNRSEHRRHAKCQLN